MTAQTPLWDDKSIEDAVYEITYQQRTSLRTIELVKSKLTGMRDGYQYQLDKLLAERDQLRSQLNEAQSSNIELINVVKMAYRKHHLSDDRIGWSELSDKLLDALSNAMGVEQLVEWQEHGHVD